jgi:hypothetical protein
VRSSVSWAPPGRWTVGTADGVPRSRPLPAIPASSPVALHLAEICRTSVAGSQVRRWSGGGCPASGPGNTGWRSVRAGGETKTRKSRRTLALPQRCVDVLRVHRREQERVRKQAGGKWRDNDLVFPSQAGTPADASHVRRSFRKVTEAAGLDPADWTPRELRHSDRLFPRDSPEAGTGAPGCLVTQLVTQ